MREIIFRVVSERPGHLEAQADRPFLRISAASHEELQHEAREALIQHLGNAHGAYRVRIRRQHDQPAGHERSPRLASLVCG